MLSEQLTTVAVINVEKIFSSFYRDSKQLRNLENMRTEFQGEIDSHIQELNDLREEKLRTGSSGDTDALDQEIAELTDFIRNLSTQRRTQLEELRQSLMSDEFVQNLQRSTRFISESEGYSLVLRSDTDGLLWWASIVDISDKVITHLIQSSEGF